MPDATERPSSTHVSGVDSSLEEPLRFLANHHRQHNPNDPKLRANPAFKSRRSSLLGAVLKAKSRESGRKVAMRPSGAAAAHTAKPRASAPAASPSLTKALPIPNSSISAERLDANISGQSASHLTTAQRQHRDLHPVSSRPGPHPEPAQCLDHGGKSEEHRPGGSPPRASFPSPTDLPEGSASTCSSGHVKDNYIAVGHNQAIPPVMDSALALGHAQHSPRATLQEEHSYLASEDDSSCFPLRIGNANAFEPTQGQPNSQHHSQSGSSSPGLVPAALSEAASPTQAQNNMHSTMSDSNIRPTLEQPTDPSAVATTFDAKAEAATAQHSNVAGITARTVERPLSEQRHDASDKGFSQTAFASVRSPQRFSSLGRRSAAPLTVQTDATGPLALPRVPVLDINDELESASSPEAPSSRTERRMSMLDFLAAEPIAGVSPQLTQASLSAEDLPRSLQTAARGSLRGAALAPPSIPLIQASRQLKLEAAAARGKAHQPRTIDLCTHVRVTVEPLMDRLTMFGSMQSSSNYSLAGTVVVEVPKLNVPRLSAAAAVARDNATTDLPSVHVEALTVHFIGYSVYVDATGRYNAVKLAELSQELLQPQGFSCPVEMIETGDQITSPDDATPRGAEADASQQTLKYETEFDLSIPGWLPASQRSRFGATFYCVQATAVVEGKAILSALSGFDRFGYDGWHSQSPTPNTARSLESELEEAVHAKGATVPRSLPASTRSKGKSTWLNKTAKQLQLRSSKKPTSADDDQSSSTSNTRHGSGPKEVVHASVERDPLFSKTTEASNQLLPNGQRSIKSECLSILIRRCRDVVPVPVARLARLATPSQVMRADSETPSLSQSMVALARLQDSADTAVAERLPNSEAIVPARAQFPASASAPVLLATHAAHRQTEATRASTSPDNAAIDEMTTRSPNIDPNAGREAPLTLAPSPRIDSDLRNWGLPPTATPPTERQTASNAERNPSFVMPRAPSAFDAPRDPAKLSTAASTLTPSTTLPNLPISMSRASNLLDPRLGNAYSPPRTSSRTAPVGRSSAPLRHFVHRPTLHLPPELGLTPDKDADGGLNFSLTLSLPSHVHVTGPKSDVLSFGVQIEVGRTEGWDTLRKWGGLRLKDMELVCLQTERHSSMPSRSFCAAFPMPPGPNKVEAADLPVVTCSRKATSAPNDAQVAAEMRLRQSYDRSLVLGHVSLVEQGKAPHPIEHNVERIRTTIVGPPPFVLRRRAQDPGQASAEEGGDASRKGKAKTNGHSHMAERPIDFSGSPLRGSPAGSGTNTPDENSHNVLSSSLRAAFAPAAQVSAGSGTSVMQPTPRRLARSGNSSSSSLRQAFQGTNNSGTIQPVPRPSTAGATSSHHAGPARSTRSFLSDLNTTTSNATTVRRNLRRGLNADSTEDRGLPLAGATVSSSPSHQHLSQSTAGASADETLSVDGSGSQRGDETRVRDREQLASNQVSTSGLSASVPTRSATRPAQLPRRSRFENAISRLSTFASSMLEQPNEGPAAGPGHEVRAGVNALAASNNAAAAASLRATYAFAGDDGQGVDLTKGRVRMTINLPLVSSDLDAARKAGSAQLLPDFESPYVRVRHKLKVKLGFGMKNNVATGQDGEDWAEALIMCVPVRFTEAPPREVQEQFGPVNVVAEAPQSATSTVSPVASNSATAGQGAHPAPGTAEFRSTAGPTPTFAEPLLPAYAQLFREDGSRLADEGEDLPRYPGRMSVVGEIDEDPTNDTAVVSDGNGSESTASISTPAPLPTVKEDHAAGSAQPSAMSAELETSGNGQMHLTRQERSGDEAVGLPRLSNLGSAPTPMDRTTSLPGHRMLTRTTSSGIFGLRSSPSYPALTGSSQSATGSPFAERSSNGGSKAHVASSAFDPLPTRPGLRRRSATTASLVTFSRITPAEVLDEALVTNPLDDEEDRMEGLQSSHTLNSLGERSQHGGEVMRASGQVEDDDDEVDDDDEEDEGLVEEDDDEGLQLNLDGPTSEGDSEPGHTTGGMHNSCHGQLSESEGYREAVDAEVARAL